MKDSIRFKITIWYSFTIFAILVLFSYFLYKKIEKVLYDYVDETIFLKGELLADSILSFIDEVGFNCSDLTNCDKRLVLFIKDIIESDWNRASFGLISLAILDLEGKVLYKSSSFPKNFKTIFKLDEDLKSEKAVFESFFLNDEPYRAYYTIFKIKDKSYIIVSLRPLTTVYLVLKTIKINILIAIPITLILTAFLGAFIVKITLMPVNEIIRTVNQITERNLNMRINLPKSNDEIFKLAKTFNDMIERLNKAFDNQKDLIHGLSHQIKTPLTIIKGEIELSLKKDRTKDEYKHTLLSISEEIDRIKELVENLLMISRLENLEGHTNTRVSILGCVEKALSELEKYAKMKNIAIKLEKKITSDFFVYFDEYMLVRSFYNIIENAIKYSNENSSIIIRVLQERDFIVEVEDYGIGISKEEIKDVFKRFYRGKNVSDKGGFGLGLYLAKSVIDKVNGKIEIIGKDKGTIVRISFKKD